MTLQPPDLLYQEIFSLILAKLQIQVMQAWATQERALMAPLHYSDSLVAHLYRFGCTDQAREEEWLSFVRVLECAGRSL